MIRSKYYPRCYREVTHKDVEIISVDYKVNTIVSFPSKTHWEYLNGEFKERSIPRQDYGFQILVHITGKEYQENKHNEEEYVCNKAKSSRKYENILNDILSKEPEDRPYQIDTFISKEPESKVIHTSEREYKDYVARIYK